MRTTSSTDEPVAWALYLARILAMTTLPFWLVLTGAVAELDPSLRTVVVSRTEDVYIEAETTLGYRVRVAGWRVAAGLAALGVGIAAVAAMASRLPRRARAGARGGSLGDVPVEVVWTDADGVSHDVPPLDPSDRGDPVGPPTR
jgi:acyl-CoA hydrolase